MKKKGLHSLAIALTAAVAFSAGSIPAVWTSSNASVKEGEFLQEGANLTVTESMQTTENKKQAPTEKMPELAPVQSGQALPTVTASPLAEKVSLLEGGIYETAKDYEKCKSEGRYTRGDCFAPVNVEMSWTAEEGAQYYTVKLAMNKELTNAVSYVTFDTALSIPDLFMGEQYYYQIIVKYADKTVKSRIFEFQTEHLPRTIYLEGVSNTRDAGGYYTVDGQYRIRQGMVYRGGKLEGITAAAKEKALKVYGFKTDLDLRAEATASPLGDTVNFVNVSGPYYVGSTGIDSQEDSSKGPWKGTYRDALLTEIRTFAKPENYPIYAHCSLGRDRTGTIIFLINALCGVGEMDLYMDYELSFFSEVGCMDGQTATNMVNNAFTSLYNYIKNYGTGTLQENTEQFMLDIGISQADIDSIRNILLEEVQK